MYATHLVTSIASHNDCEKLPFNFLSSNFMVLKCHSELIIIKEGGRQKLDYVIFRLYMYMYM